MQLGMVGLGRMGANMVRRLLKGGHECVVFDMSPKAVSELTAEHAVETMRDALPGAAALEGLRQPHRERRVVASVVGERPLQETGEELHDVVRGQLLRVETLVRERDVDELFEVLDRRFASKYNITHTPVPGLDSPLEVSARRVPMSSRVSPRIIQ